MQEMYHQAEKPVSASESTVDKVSHPGHVPFRTAATKRLGAAQGDQEPEAARSFPGRGRKGFRGPHSFPLLTAHRPTAIGRSPRSNFAFQNNAC